MARSQPAMREGMAYAKVVARAWSDPAFKQQLVSDPHTVLAAEGITVAHGVTVRVVENTEKLMHLVLPVKPSDHELSVEALQRLRADVDPCCHSCNSCFGPTHVGGLTKIGGCNCASII